jgi:hypothetical protein
VFAHRIGYVLANLWMFAREQKMGHAGVAVPLVGLTSWIISFQLSLRIENGSLCTITTHFQDVPGYSCLASGARGVLVAGCRA